jgi:hypothetical protein
MVFIRAHFDGTVIVPDEPVTLPPQTQVMILVDSDETASTSNLEKATREYYLGLASNESEDVAWGNGLAHDSSQAWDEEWPLCWKKSSRSAAKSGSLISPMILKPVQH